MFSTCCETAGFLCGRKITWRFIVRVFTHFYWFREQGHTLGVSHPAWGASGCARRFNVRALRPAGRCVCVCARASVSTDLSGTHGRAVRRRLAVAGVERERKVEREKEEWAFFIRHWEMVKWNSYWLRWVADPGLWITLTRHTHTHSGIHWQMRHRDKRAQSRR